MFPTWETANMTMPSCVSMLSMKTLALLEMEVEMCEPTQLCTCLLSDNSLSSHLVWPSPSLSSLSIWSPSSSITDDISLSIFLPSLLYLCISRYSYKNIFRKVVLKFLCRNRWSPPNQLKRWMQPNTTYAICNFVVSVNPILYLHSLYLCIYLV